MMSKYSNDIEDIHTKFGVNRVVNGLTPNQLKDYLVFRVGCLQEELDELKSADNADDAVDALIDLVYFAVGTLDAFEVNSDLAWSRVHDANMSKEPGIKPGRPNPYGFPDMIKPHGWQAPSHEGNYGLMDQLDFPINYTSE